MSKVDPSGMYGTGADVEGGLPACYPYNSWDAYYLAMGNEKSRNYFTRRTPQQSEQPKDKEPEIQGPPVPESIKNANPRPVDPSVYNQNDDVQNYNNCYTAAAGWTKNPLTGEAFTHKQTPGEMMYGRSNADKESWKEYAQAYLAGTPNSNAAFLDLTIADMIFNGRKAILGKEGQGGWAVAVGVRPGTEAEDNADADYHYIWDEPAIGEWYQKSGESIASNKEMEGQSNYGVKISEVQITNPEETMVHQGYQFIGYIYVSR